MNRCQKVLCNQRKGEFPSFFTKRSADYSIQCIAMSRGKETDKFGRASSTSFLLFNSPDFPEVLRGKSPVNIEQENSIYRQRSSGRWKRFSQMNSSFDNLSTLRESNCEKALEWHIHRLDRSCFARHRHVELEK